MAEVMSAAEFKAKCLQVMERVAQSGESVVVTKRGKPVAQLTPIRSRPKTLRGFLKGRVRTTGDIVRPVGGRWNADRV